MINIICSILNTALQGFDGNASWIKQMFSRNIQDKRHFPGILTLETAFHSSNKPIKADQRQGVLDKIKDEIA